MNLLRYTGLVLAACAALAFAPGCGGDDDPAAPAADASPGPVDTDEPDQFLFGGDRPVSIQFPDDYDHATPTPLLIVLHGYSAAGLLQEGYFGVRRLVNEAGVLLLSPDGTVDDSDKQFWNATDACCDFYDTNVDDVGYLSGLIDEVKAEFNVDPARVYLIGHSNGGYMAYRMACDRADQIAAIVSLAGAAYLDTSACNPSEAVSVLQIHGTDDASVDYLGGDNRGDSSRGYPSAAGSVANWAAYDGCEALVVSDAPRNIDATLSGDETTVQRHDGCPAGIEAALWTIEGGEHLPNLVPDFADQVWAWMDAHPKP